MGDDDKALQARSHRHLPRPAPLITNAPETSSESDNTPNYEFAKHLRFGPGPSLHPRYQLGLPNPRNLPIRLGADVEVIDLTGEDWTGAAARSSSTTNSLASRSEVIDLTGDSSHDEIPGKDQSEAQSPSQATATTPRSSINAALGNPIFSPRAQSNITEIYARPVRQLVWPSSTNGQQYLGPQSRVPPNQSSGGRLRRSDGRIILPNGRVLLPSGRVPGLQQRIDGSSSNTYSYVPESATSYGNNSSTQSSEDVTSQNSGSSRGSIETGVDVSDVERVAQEEANDDADDEDSE